MDCKYNYFLGLLFAVAVGGQFVPNKLIFMIQISSDTSIDFQYQPPSPSFEMSMETTAKLQTWSDIKCLKPEKNVSEWTQLIFLMIMIVQ